MSSRRRHLTSSRARALLLIAATATLACGLAGPVRAQTSDLEDPAEHNETGETEVVEDVPNGEADPSAVEERAYEGMLNATSHGATLGWQRYGLMSDDPSIVAERPTGALRYALAGSAAAVMTTHIAVEEPAVEEPAVEEPDVEEPVEVSELVVAAAGAAAEGVPGAAEPPVDGPAVPEPGGLRRAIAGVVNAVDVETAVLAYWRPPDFRQENWEWIQIKTGEWLRGQINHMRNDELEFDSRKFKILNIDFDDVIGFYSPRVNTYVFGTTEGTHAGPAQMRNGVVTIQAEDGEHRISRKSLLAILQGEPTELNRWRLEASVGASANIGTTSQASFSARLDITRETAFTRLELGYTGNLGGSNGAQTINNHFGNAAFLLLPTKRFSITVLSTRTGMDRFQNLALSMTLSAGVSYKLVDLHEFTFEAGGGPAFQFTEYGSTTSSGDQNNFGVGLIAALGMEWKITGDLDFDASHTAVIVMNDYDLSQYITSASFEYELRRNLSIDLRLDWTHLVEPVPRADGATPARDQVSTTFNLGVKI